MTAGLSGRALQVVRDAVTDPGVRARYEAKVSRGGRHDCWPFLGAIHPHGHGRFWVGTISLSPGRRRDVVVIAHRFGWALDHGSEALAAAPVLAHTCDEPSCQNPTHLVVGTTASNYGDWLWRRGAPGSPLRDRRGPAGRARAIRDAILAGAGPDEVARVKQAGVTGVDRDQLTLW